MDWNRHWKGFEGDEETRAAGRRIAERLDRFFDRVRPGGTLVFNYPNRGTQRWYDENADGSDRERFRLVIDGENLLTYDRIESILDTRPRSFWRAVGEDEWRSLGRTNPCVYVQKPTD